MGTTDTATDDGAIAHGESRRTRLVLALVTAASVAPLLAGKHLPFTDLPEHTAVASALAHWNDPAFRVAEHYAIAFPRTPYVLFHFVAAGLTLLTRDAEVAVRLMLVAIGIAFPLSLRSLLGALGVDRRLALFAPMVFWNRALALGLLPFVASVPVLVFAVATVLRSLRGTSVRARLLLAGLGLCLFYLHVSAYTVFVLTAAALVVHVRGPRAALREAWWLAPSVACGAAWLSLGQLTTHGEAFLEKSDIGYSSPARALLVFPLWLHDVWKTHLDEACAVVWWAALVVLTLASMRARASKARELVTRLIPLACALIVYFATPNRAGVGVFLNVRLAPLLALFAIPVLRIPRDTLATKSALAGVAVATLSMSAVSTREIRRADREEMGGFDELIARTRPGARVLALNFDTTSAHASFAPWLYAVAYHRIRKGGVTAYSFAALEHWPLRYTRDGAPPSKTAAFWATDPCVFRNSTDGPYYDYILARGDVDPFVGAPRAPRWTMIAEASRFRLYERSSETTEPSRSVVDRGPCHEGSSR